MQEHLKTGSRFFAVIFAGVVILTALPGIIAFADSFRSWMEDIYLMHGLYKNRVWIENEKNILPPYPVLNTDRKNAQAKTIHGGIADIIPQEETSNDELSIFDRISRKVDAKRKEYEEIIIKEYPFRYEFSTMNGLFKHFLGMRAPYPEASSVIQRQDRKSISSVHHNSNAFSTTQLLSYKAVADQLNIPFMLMIHPAQGGLTDDALHYGLTPQDNARIDNTLKNLQSQNITIFDLRKAFIKQGYKHEDVYDRGDHHWNVEGAIAGAGFLAKYLNENYGMDYQMQYFDKTFYHEEIFRETSLGSLGKKVTVAYTGGLEDFELYHPVWKTRFTVEYIRRKYRKAVTETRVVTGDFKTTMIDYSWLFGNPHESNLYGMFLSADNYFVRIVNHDYPDGKKIIFIKDSFANAMLPYLALQTKEIILLDERHTGQDVEMILKRENPDLIIYCNIFFDDLE